MKSSTPFEDCGTLAVPARRVRGAALGEETVRRMAEESAEGESTRRPLARRRRANVAGGRQHKHEVKVSPEEEARLLRLAAKHRVSVPRLLVESTLAEVGETPTERRNAIASLFGLHRLLASIANNVNQMAKATNATGEVQADMRATLAAVRRTADRIDQAVDGLSRR